MSGPHHLANPLNDTHSGHLHLMFPPNDAHNPPHLVYPLSDTHICPSNMEYSTKDVQNAYHLPYLPNNTHTYLHGGMAPLSIGHKVKITRWNLPSWGAMIPRQTVQTSATFTLAIQGL